MFEIRPVAQHTVCMNRHNRTDKPDWVPPRSVKLLDQVRHELATDYVKETQLSFAEIAFLLGFASPAAFHKAFRRWEAEPAGAYRERMRTR